MAWLAALSISPAWATDNCDGNSGTGAAIGDGSVVCGINNNASGSFSSSLGRSNNANANESSAVGFANTTDGLFSSAMGYFNSTGFNGTGGYLANAFGSHNSANGDRSSAVGLGNSTGGTYANAFGSFNIVNGNRSSALGYANTTTGANSSAMGSYSRSLADLSVALGAGDQPFSGATVEAGATGSVAIGQGATVNANVTGAVALGQGSVADANNTVSVGASGAERRITNVAAGTAATDAANVGQVQAVQTTADAALSNLQTAVNQLLASGVCGLSGGSITCGNNLALGSGQSIDANASNAVVLGTNAQIVNPSNATGAAASGAVAIGYGAKANVDPSVAIGNFADASGADAVAVGDQSSATGNRTVALGFQATASHTGSVALGAGSVTSADNTVSVGSAGAERRITNVATPIDPTDASNKAYVDALIGGGSAHALQQANVYTDRRFDQVKRYAARGVAASMATTPQIAPALGESGFGIGMGYYDGQSAIGASFAHLTRGEVQLNLGAAYTSGGKPALRGGFGWKW